MKNKFEISIDKIVAVAAIILVLVIIYMKANTIAKDDPKDRMGNPVDVQKH